MKEFGCLIKGKNGLLYADGKYLYFPDRRSNLKEGIITNIRVVKDFRDDRGYAFIDADMVETESFTDEELCNYIDNYTEVKRLVIGSSELLFCGKTKNNFDFNIFASKNERYDVVDVYLKYEGGLVQIYHCYDERLLSRSPYNMFSNICKPLDTDFLKQYCKSNFIHSDLVMKLALLKVVEENTFLESSTFSYNAELGIFKVEIFYTYTKSVDVRYYFYNGEKVLRTLNIDALGKLSFKEIKSSTIRQYATELHVCMTALSFDTSIIDKCLCSKLFNLGGSSYLVYAFNINTVTAVDLENIKLQELIQQSSETYMNALKKYAKNLTAKNISSLTLQSWYMK